MRTNYVMIDFENVQPESLAGLQREHIKDGKIAYTL